jgi:hypothetical protein
MDLAQRLNLARAGAARRCAPADLAIAEANSDFADVELANNNESRARQHIHIASQAVDRALFAAKLCGSDSKP